VRHPYFESILLIERLHRHFLDVVKVELDRLSLFDINNVQSLILYNIGADTLTVGELTQRGYYLGSNVSYNVKKLVENGYLLQERSPHDRRATHVRLSPKGRGLCDSIGELFARHTKHLDATVPTSQALTQANNVLRTLERFWTDQINFGMSQTPARGETGGSTPTPVTSAAD
jgi:DNA-binding MarR family transcriptional regulator